MTLKYGRYNPPLVLSKTALLLSQSFTASMASSLSTSSLVPFKNVDNGRLSSSMFPSPINLSSNSNISLQFFSKKPSSLLSSSPRFLTVIAMAPPKPGGKSKKVVGLIKLALEAGKATPAPPDKSFTFILKTPPASVLLLKAAGAEKGSKDPKLEKVGKVTIEQLRAIATEKLPDLNCTTVESAMRIIAGTAANMGIDVDPPVLEPKKESNPVV
ncbi:hypothetical protein Patl1_17380 [Pistacia atlantica]|uniref:Uncharacterized protein n=1 Tax=Pistacia atlantica TaxID=434234 RepID=A0ACC1BY64_9ROSI|nr:hypothetical protein Patl1_17380 [Pistacia atlantica]